MPAGLIAGAGAIGGALISSSASSDASKAASQAAASNNALEQSIYNSNTTNLTPFMQRGNAAGDELNGLLGVGSQTTTGGTPDYGSYVANNPDILANYNKYAAPIGESQAAFGQQFYNSYGAAGNSEDPDTLPTTGGTSSSQGALNNYLNSTNYNFTYGQGLQAVQQAKATSGLLRSGSNLTATSNYGQNTAQSAITSYMNALISQQQTGLSGASALAGVGQGYASGVSANNNSAASAAGSAALAGAANTTSGINSALGSALTSYGLSQGQSTSFGSTPTYTGGALNNYGAGSGYTGANMDGLY